METFEDWEVDQAIKQFLEYGEETLNNAKGQKGYFSGNGWAARVLRYHLKQRELKTSEVSTTQLPTIKELYALLKVRQYIIKRVHGCDNTRGRWIQHLEQAILDRVRIIQK